MLLLHIREVEMIEVPGCIERQIEIRADIDRVFELVSRPGWWINENEVTESTVSTEGEVSTVTHPKHGSFRVRTVASRPPHYVSFRWLAGMQDAGVTAPGTLVEFSLSESPVGVLVKVLESGFASLPVSAEVQRKNFEDNSKGWEFELEVARKYFEGA